jgi:AraC family transcriptional regulator of adaptative response/methylated-DNA-[protein]-cysteine methyltransferase
MGVSPADYARARRSERLRTHLRSGTDVTTSLYEAGFDSPAPLYASAGQEFGMTPGLYRNGGAGTTIRYSVTDSPLGRLLVGFTSRGVSAILIGESDAELVNALRDEYPEASLERHAGSTDWIRTILSYLEGEIPHPDLPLDVRATAFQRRVWQALRLIRPGETQSYGEVARSIGQPGAARAVAQACATNRVALAIPCHRVVRSDGAAGGYRWGPERKEWLLALEGGR